MKKLHKKDIERLWELELEKFKRIHQRTFSKEELYITALDYTDDTIILRSKIAELTDTGIIVVTNPDRAERDGEIYHLIELTSLKMVIFTFNQSEDEILELLEIIDEEEEGEGEEDALYEL